MQLGRRPPRQANRQPIRRSTSAIGTSSRRRAARCIAKLRTNISPGASAPPFERPGEVSSTPRALWYAVAQAVTDDVEAALRVARSKIPPIRSAGRTGKTSRVSLRVRRSRFWR